MSYIEKRETNGTTYATFIKKIKIQGKTHVLRNYIGKLTPLFSKENHLLSNFDLLTQLEFNIREKYLMLTHDELTFNLDLLNRVELKSIKIANFIEALEIKNIIFTKFAIEFIFNSNNIEGSRISRTKVLEIVEKGDITYHNRNEVIEVQNSIIAFEYILSGFKFNLASVKRLYYLLTNNLNMENGEAYPKGFKKIANIIDNEATTPPECVEDELNYLLKNMRMNKKSCHPLKLAFDFHRKYEEIHPFLDGNGRTGRLIMDKILIAGGYFPMIVFAENKRAYFNVLSKARKGAVKKYNHFMLQQMDKTYDFILGELNCLTKNA